MSGNTGADAVITSQTKWDHSVAGSKPGTHYTVTFGTNTDPERGTKMDFACTCPAFTYRRDRSSYCKHINQVKHLCQETVE